MKYIVVCLSVYDHTANNFRICHKGKSVFETEEEANIAKDEDMKEYCEAENDSGYKASIVGNHIEWDNADEWREAKWYVYAV